MAKKNFTWRAYSVPVSPNSIFRREAGRHAIVGGRAADAAGVREFRLEEARVAPGTVVATIPLPDLSAHPDPRGKFQMLLETAAEIEHALMVQYLYAGYSLKDPTNLAETAGLTPSQRSAIRAWTRVLFDISREEMGHLMTVQNLLLLIGSRPNLEREDFPPTVDLYPFKLRLQPLTQKSLAKYVVAESPTHAAGVEDILALAIEKAGMPINHVAVLYALLGVICSTEDQVASGGSGSTAWDEALREVARAALQQDSDPSAWHLRDSDFHPEHAARQGDPDDWTHGTDQVRVHRPATRDDARRAIRDVGEQGEGPGSPGQPSHFERFLAIYRGIGTGEPFPPEGSWMPTRPVATDPVTSAIDDPRARRWSELLDARYGFLLGLIEHYLLLTAPGRQILVGWIFAEMRSRVGHIARQLTTIASGAGGGTAGAAFTLPAALHLGNDETARWTLHRRRVADTIAIVDAIRVADPTDREDEFLITLLDTERRRLEYIDEKLAGHEPEISFARDIRPMFRFANDIPHMRQQGTDLTDLATVREMAPTIIQRLRGTESGLMPPPPSMPWTNGQIALFERWVSQGSLL